MWRLIKKMEARDPHEAHRVSTPLELLFDLCFVVAVSQASSHLHHAIVEGHGLAMLPMFLRIFFAIWWAWMNFTWFASAYDADDVPYRVAVLVQIAGVLMIAAGVARGFERGDFTILTLGYALMRVGLVSLWLRAGLSSPTHRRTALRYAFGVSVVEVGWLCVLLLPPELVPLAWMVGVPLELAVPLWAERKGQTPWHPHHISERYGLLTLIVLGESVLAVTNAIQASIDSAHPSTRFLCFIGGSLLVLFSMWWLYFDQSAHRQLVSSKRAFVWGYGHYFVFASTAAVGAGLAAASDFASGHGDLSAQTAGAAVALPVIVYLLSVWTVHVRPLKKGLVVDGAFLGAAVLTYAVCGLPSGVLAIGLVMTSLVAVTVVADRRALR